MMSKLASSAMRSSFGYVYVISNKYFNTRYDHPLGGGKPLSKIGRTINSPTKRAIHGDQAFRNKTFLPTEFRVECAIYCENHIQVESYLHKIFENFKTKVYDEEVEEVYGKEWFVVDVEEIKKYMEGMVISNSQNSWWKEKVDVESIENGGESKVSIETQPKKKKKKKKKKKSQKGIKIDGIIITKEEIEEQLKDAGWKVVKRHYGAGKNEGRPYWRFNPPRRYKENKQKTSHTQAYRSLMKEMRNDQ